MSLTDDEVQFLATWQKIQTNKNRKEENYTGTLKRTFVFARQLNQPDGLTPTSSRAIYCLKMCSQKASALA